MAKVLKEGKQHKGIVWTDTCDICESRLKLYEERNDPAVKKAYDCGAYFKGLDYVCPVCGAENSTYAAPSGRFVDINNDECEKRARRGKTRREYVTLTREDLEEIRSYQKDEEEASDE